MGALSTAMGLKINIENGRIQEQNYNAYMFEALKTIGSFLGLLTAIAFFYDRMAKGRPVVSLTVALKDSRKLVCIRITNPSDYDIAILGGSVTPKVYFLTEDLETRSLLENQIRTGPYFMLKPKQERELVLAPMFENGVAREVTPQSVIVRIFWRRCNATWMPQIPAFVLTSTDTIRKYGLEKYT